MANSYAYLHYRVVFSTKNREPWISVEVEDRVWSYLAGIAKENEMTPIRIGGIEDHLHVLVEAPPTLAPSKIAQLIKGGSSVWIRDHFPEWRSFAWQDGYGAFSVSRSNVDVVSNYIRNQREHHRNTAFQTEYRALLEKHGVDYNERYLWG